MTKEEMIARIAQLEAEAQAAKDKPRSLSFKVSAKGALSVYGMGRFPVTLYSEQWEKLSDAMPQILDFIKDNAGTLTRKEVKG